MEGAGGAGTEEAGERGSEGGREECTYRFVVIPLNLLLLLLQNLLLELKNFEASEKVSQAIGHGHVQCTCTCERSYRLIPSGVLTAHTE